MSKCFVLLLLGVIIFSSCSRPASTNDELSPEVEKTDFFVETTLWKVFSGESFIEKTGQIRSSQDIELTANAAGRVWNISVKSGDGTTVGKTLVQLEDNLGNYNINLQRWNNNIERAKINYESQQIALDKQIFDAGVNLENLQRSLATLKADSEQNIIQAKDSFENSQDTGDLERLDLQIDKIKLQEDKLQIQAEKLELQIEKLQDNIEKSRFDYDLRLKSDEQAIQNYGGTLRTQYSSLEILMSDMIQFGDEIFGITEENRRANDAFEDYLWAKDSVQKNNTRQKLLELIWLQESVNTDGLEVKINSKNLSQEDIENAIDEIEIVYDTLRVFLSWLEGTLNSSITSIGDFSEAQVSGLISNTNVFQSQVQGNFAAFISFESGVDTFFETYKDSQESLLRSIDLQENDIRSLEQDRVSLDADAISLEKDVSVLEKDKAILQRNLESGELSAETSLERTRIWIDDNIANLEAQIRSAQNTLSNARKNKDVTLRSLQNAIDEARIGYSSSAKEFSKLTVKSPINGTVSEVLIDEGQEVFSGTPLLRIISDKTPEVEISFSTSERDLISKGQKVYVLVWEDRIEWSIYTISDIADQNLNYKATVTFSTWTNIIGNLVSVEVPVETGKMLIPLNIVTTQWGEIGTVKTLSWSTFADVRVRMWEVFGEYVEVVSCAKNCVDLNIITNDVSNYDENKFEIVEK